MSKAHRGTGIRSEVNHGRGKCPRCGNENVKVLYEKEIDGNRLNSVQAVLCMPPLYKGGFIFYSGITSIFEFCTEICYFIYCFGNFFSSVGSVCDLRCDG